MAARSRRVALAEPVEDVREQIGGDAVAGIAHRDFRRRARLPRSHRHAPAPRRELDGIADEIGDDLLKTIGIPAQRHRLDVLFDLDPLLLGGRPDRVDAGTDDGVEPHARWR